jgi:hypothetical protein
MAESAYPLSWPTGWPRSAKRRQSPFGRRGPWTLARAAAVLHGELRMLGADGSNVISSNVTGTSRAAPADPGVAVYFTLKKQRTALACDRWERVEDNLRAIAKHVEAMRGMERWGVGSLERSFLGYAALPPGPDAKPARPWREVLGFPGDWTPSTAIVEAAFRDKSKALHPDVGGDATGFNELTRARDEALRDIGAA